MYRIIYLIGIVLLPIVFAACCNCTNNEPKLTADELGWIPTGQLDDSMVYSNGKGETKTFRITESNQMVTEEKCAGPCCVCPEDNVVYYYFQLTGVSKPAGDEYQEGLMVSLTKSSKGTEKLFSWGCPYGSFHEFDYEVDTITINHKVYSHVFVKELDVCNIRKLFFSKSEGLLRFDYTDGIWERIY